VPSTYSIQQAVQNPQTLGVVLSEILFAKYGDAWVDWDPVTIYLELRDEYNAEPVSEAMDRISAAQVVLASDSFFKRPEAFFNVANTLASGSPGFTVFDPVTVPEAAWALTEVALLREYDEFSHAVRGVIRAILKDDGYTDDYPAIFDVVLAERPTAEVALEAVGTDLRDQEASGVEEFVNDQLAALVFQFDQIPQLEGRFDALLRRRDANELATLQVMP